MNLAGCQIQNTYLRDKQDGLLKPEAILLVSFQKNLHSVKPFLFQKKSELVFKKDSGIVKIPPRQSGKLNTLSEWRDTERLSRPGLRLTDELELRFLENLREHGRTKGTISTYRRNLSKLRKSLPEGSNLDPAFLSSWQSELLEQGYSPGTVNSCTATVNGLLEFAGRRDLQAGQIPINGEVSSPELTRNEYLRLLQAAKLLKKRQTYLLVLLFGTMDLPLRSLSRVTVEAVQEGWVFAPRRLRVPPCLRAELLAYAGDRERPGVLHPVR